MSKPSKNGQPLFPSELTPARIRWVRENLAMSHAEFAVRCCVCETAVYRWEAEGGRYNRRPGRRSLAVLRALEAEAIRQAKDGRKDLAALEEQARRFAEEFPVGRVPPEALELYRQLRAVLRGKKVPFRGGPAYQKGAAQETPPR